MKQIKIDYVYEVLLSLAHAENHGRELSKELKTSLTRIQSILTQLREDNILDYKQIGKNHIYFIKKNLIAKSFVLNAENYKLARTVSRYPLLSPIFQDLINNNNCELIILFGSYAKGTANNDSDIDIYADTKDIKTKTASDLISIKIGPFNPEDLLIKEIIKNHVIIKGVETYYEKLKFFK